MAEYTLSEACVLLGISRRTLDYWLQETGINARNLPTDARKKVLTMAQITKLAAAHGKKVKEVEGLAGLVVEVAVLRERVEALEGVKEQIAALESRLAALETRPTIRPSLTIQATPAASQHMPEARLVDADEQPALRLPARQRVPPTSAASGGMPPGLESWREYAKRHGMPESTVKSARDKGKLPVISGEWKVGNHWITGALDTAGQRRFWELWSRSPEIRRCSVFGCLCEQYLPDRG